MHTFSKRTFRTLYRLEVCTWIITGGWMLFFVCSCDKNTSTGSQQYFDAVLRIFDSVYSLDKEKAILYLDKAYLNQPQARATDLAEKYNRLSDYYGDEKNDFRSAIYFADSALRVLGTHLRPGSKATLAVAAYFKKGNAYFKMHQFEEAIHNYNESHLLIGRYLNNDPCALRIYYECLGNLYFAQSKFRNALEYFKKNLHLADSCYSDFQRFAYTQGNLDNIGLCYQGLGESDSAYWYYDAALSYIEKFENSFTDKKEYVGSAKMVVYNNIATYAFLQNNMKTAEKTLSKAIQIIEDYKQPRNIAYLKLLLAETYLRLGIPEKCFPLLQQIDSYFEQLQYESTLIWYYQVKADYYSLVRDSGQALIHLRKSNQVNDSITRRDRQFLTTDVKKEFEYKEQGIRNELLKKDNEVKSIYLWIAAIVTAMAAAIVLLIWWNLRKSADNINTLKSLNQEINRKNQELQKSLISLEQSHEENNRIVRVIAHDLKNPMGGIRIMAKLLLRQGLPEASNDMIQTIEATCSNSMMMINELLHPKKASLSEEMESVDMVKLLKSSVELLQTKASEKNQRLILTTETITAFVNRQKIWRVTSNLITNAIKFSPSNSDIKINLQKQDQIIILSVQDEGMGIPENFRDAIYDYNTEISRPGTNGEVSNGIGLSITKKIVEEHEGKIWHNSNETGGTTFFVQLPLLT